MAARARSTGRPSKLTPLLRERVLGVVMAGSEPSDALRAHGVSRQLEYVWRKRAEDETDPEHDRFKSFFDDLEEAQARVIAELRLTVKTAAAEDWKAAVRMLEAVDPAFVKGRERLDIKQENVNPPAPSVIVIESHDRDEAALPDDIKAILGIGTGGRTDASAVN